VVDAYSLRLAGFFVAMHRTRFKQECEKAWRKTALWPFLLHFSKTAILF